MSVWDGIDRVMFESNLAGLARKQKYQEQSRLPGRAMANLLEKEDSFVLPPDVELQLADDFAFLSSTTTWPCDVSAAAVAQEVDSPRLCLTIAANEGMRLRVKSAMRELLNSLERHARGELRSEEVQAQSRDAILPVHRDRILGRLGSAKTKGQKKSSVCIIDRVASLRQAIKSSKQRHGTAVSDLLEQVQQLKRSIDTVERATARSDEENRAICAVLKSSFEMSKVPLLQRLRSLNIQTILETSREIRELRALANYWRIFRYLSEISKKYRRSFELIELKILQPGPVRRWNGLKQYVHAEIQILVHFDLYPAHRLRFIGASKKPCFLCYCFIHAHATYSVSNSYGEVYVKWTVPDESHFSTQARRKLSLALQHTTNDVQKALSNANRSRHPYLQPLQTVSKLLVDKLSIASASTVGTVASRFRKTPEDVLTTSVLPEATAVLCPERIPASISQSQQSTTTISGSGSEIPSISVQCKSTLPNWPRDCKVSPDQPVLLQLGEMEIFLEMESRPDSPIDAGSSFGRCKICPACRTNEKAMRVDVKELDECDKVIEKTAGMAILSFVLCGCSQEYLVELQWSR